MELKSYFLPLSSDLRRDFAERCDTNVQQLLNIAYGCKSCSPELAINIERETGGKVRVESLASHSKSKPVDWAYIRGTARRKQESRVA